MRKIGIVILGLCWCLIGLAQAVSVNEAYQKAQAFMGEKGKHVAAMPRKAPGTTGHDAAAYYVFNATGNEGFVLVAGDSRVGDILGYSDEGSFDEEQLPDNMRSWLAGYADQIEALRQGRKVEPARVPTHAAIAPLITSRWDQGEADGDAYNRQCPKISGKYCMTGCVATAMAQVMRYNRWPTAKCAQIPAYESNETLGTLSALSARKFDWDNMLDQYPGGETTAQMNAVAWLMRYCGQAVKMDYGTKSSAAYSESVVRALREYFDYDISTRYVLRMDYNAAGWDNLLYNELKAHRPICYDGSSTGGGHAFVCDGYDGKGFYHINWGWGGSHDGYYKISVLNPDGGGTGSSGTEDGYTMSQGAVVGIQKNTHSSADDKSILNLADLSYSGSTLEAVYWNRTGMEGTFEYGFAYQDVNNNNGKYKLRTRTDAFGIFVQRTYTLDVNTMNLADGTYRFYPFSRLEGSGWYRVQGDLDTYIEVEMKNGKMTSISKHPRGDLHVKSVTCTGNKIVNMPQEVVIKVNNTGEEFNNKFYLFVSQTDDKGEYVMATNMVIEKGATEEASLFFTPESTGTWNVWIDIDESGKNNIGPYQVKIVNPPTGENNLVMTNYKVDVAGTVDIHVTVKNKASYGYYRPVACAIFNPEGGTSIKLERSGNLNLAAGKTVSLDYHFEGLTVGKQYFAMLALYPTHTAENLSVFGSRMYFVPTVTGIDNITVESLTPDPSPKSGYFTIDGRKLDQKPTKKGVYIVDGKKRVVK